MKEVTILRLKCKTCKYSWRIYPEGIRSYSARSKRIVFLGIVLYSAGLSFEKSAGFLNGMIGEEIEHFVTIWRDVQMIAENLRRRKVVCPKVRGAKVVVGLDGTYTRVKGKVQPLLLATNMSDGTTIHVNLLNEWKQKELKQFIKEVAKELGIPVKDLKIVTDDLDMYKGVAEKEKVANHQVCLGHVKKNLSKRLKKLKGKIPQKYLDTLKTVLDPPNEVLLSQLLEDKKLWQHPKRQCKSWIAYRGIIGDLKRNWKEYTAYLTDPTLPTSNNRTEQAIGRSKVRYKLTRGFKSQMGVLNFFTLTQTTGQHQFQTISSVC